MRLTLLPIWVAVAHGFGVSGRGQELSGPTPIEDDRAILSVAAAGVTTTSEEEGRDLTGAPLVRMGGRDEVANLHSPASDIDQKVAVVGLPGAKPTESKDWKPGMKRLTFPADNLSGESTIKQGTPHQSHRFQQRVHHPRLEVGKDAPPTPTHGEPFITNSQAFTLVGVLFVFVLVGLWFGRHAVSAYDDDVELTKFRWSYLLVWAFAIGTDWIQGPYVYALYKQFNFEHDQIATFYLTGFATAAIAGFALGPAADKFGRKRFALVYCVLTAGQCVTKHFASFPLLMVGRLLGGMASCLLFTAFETWMVSESSRRGFSEQALKVTFSQKELFSSFCAIFAGIIGEGASRVAPLTKPFEDSSLRLGGYVAPFDVVIILCLICGLLVAFWWGENHGSSEGLGSNFMTALAVLREPSVFLIGLAVALLESSMFLWVFIWTPALSDPGFPDPPYGLIFGSFMAAKMVGTQIFTALTMVMSTCAILVLAIMLACGSHIASYLLVRGGTGGSEGTLWPLLGSFVLFELAIGLYWPAAGTLKAQLVPESCRATIYNLYRVPLNLIVFGMMAFLSHEVSGTLLATSVMLALGTFSAMALMWTVEGRQRSSVSKPLLAADPESYGS